MLNKLRLKTIDLEPILTKALERRDREMKEAERNVDLAILRRLVKQCASTGTLDYYVHYNCMSADLEMKPLPFEQPAEIEKWLKQSRDKTYDPTPTLKTSDYTIQVKNINIR